MHSWLWLEVGCENHRNWFFSGAFEILTRQGTQKCTYISLAAIGKMSLALISMIGICVWRESGRGTLKRAELFSSTRASLWIQSMNQVEILFQPTWNIISSLIRCTFFLHCNVPVIGIQFTVDSCTPLVDQTAVIIVVLVRTL